MAEGTQAFIELDTYKRDNANLKLELARKDQLIAKLSEQAKTCLELVDTLNGQTKLRDEIISTQANTIKRLGTKPKTWAIGLQAGYGYGFSTEVKRMPFIGIGITKTFFRF